MMNPGNSFPIDPRRVSPRTPLCIQFRPEDSRAKGDRSAADRQENPPPEARGGGQAVKLVTLVTLKRCFR